MGMCCSEDRFAVVDIQYVRMYNELYNIKCLYIYT